MTHFLCTELGKKIVSEKFFKFNSYFFSTFTPITNKLDDIMLVIHFWKWSIGIRNVTQTSSKFDGSMLVTHFSEIQVLVLEPQIWWWYTGNTFLVCQQQYFWQNDTLTFFCWKWWRGQISLELALSWFTGNFNSKHKLFLL